MAQEKTRQRAGTPGKGRALAKRPPRHALALAGLLVLSAFLNVLSSRA